MIKIPGRALVLLPAALLACAATFAPAASRARAQQPAQQPAVEEWADDFNGEEGLRRTLRNMPRAFHLMLYGNSSTENHWGSARVVAAR